MEGLYPSVGFASFDCVRRNYYFRRLFPYLWLANYVNSLDNERVDLGLRDGRVCRPASSLRLVAFLFVVIFLLLYGLALALFGGRCASRARPGRGLGLRGDTGLRSGSEVDVESAGFSGRRVVPARRYGWRGGCVDRTLSRED